MTFGLSVVASAAPAVAPLSFTTIWSPGRMSGVALTPPPAPQQMPPGWLISMAGLPALMTSAPASGPVAEPMTVPPRTTSTVIGLPALPTKPSIDTKSRSGKIVMLSGKTGTAADAGAAVSTPAVAATVAAVSPASTRMRRLPVGGPDDVVSGVVRWLMVLLGSGSTSVRPRPGSAVDAPKNPWEKA